MVKGKKRRAEYGEEEAAASVRAMLSPDGWNEAGRLCVGCRGFLQVPSSHVRDQVQAAALRRRWADAQPRVTAVQ